MSGGECSRISRLTVGGFILIKLRSPSFRRAGEFPRKRRSPAQPFLHHSKNLSDNTHYETRCQINLYYFLAVDIPWHLWQFVGMSIKLRIENGSLVMQAILKDEALAGLLEIVSTNQSDDAAPAPPNIAFAPTGEPPNGTQPGAISLTIASKLWLTEHAPAEVLNMVGWEENSEKILLLAAVLEVRAPDQAWRSSDMEKLFAEAKEQFPSNFPRDIATAIKDGLIAKATDRTYCVSRTGWKRVSEAVNKAMFSVPN